jgi:hypothetical protein
MTIFKKTKAGPQSQTPIQRRVASISSPDLVAWSENALFVIGKGVTGWLKDRNKDHLHEAELGAEALLAITQELVKRSKHE